MITLVPFMIHFGLFAVSIILAALIVKLAFWIMEA